MNTLSVRRRHRGTSTKAVRWVAAVGLAALMGACASTPPPTAQMAVSAAAVAHAAGAGSAELAPVEMKSARDKLDRAKVAMTAKDYELAKSLAQEAQIDAQLAEAKAHSLNATKAADEVHESGRALREEMNRKSN